MRVTWLSKPERVGRLDDHHAEEPLHFLAAAAHPRAERGTLAEQEEVPLASGVQAISSRGPRRSDRYKAAGVLTDPRPVVSETVHQFQPRDVQTDVAGDDPIRRAWLRRTRRVRR